MAFEFQKVWTKNVALQSKNMAFKSEGGILDYTIQNMAFENQKGGIFVLHPKHGISKSEGGISNQNMAF